MAALSVSGRRCARFHAQSFRAGRVIDLVVHYQFARKESVATRRPDPVRLGFLRQGKEIENQ
jgi:hypothetical protein